VNLSSYVRVLCRSVWKCFVSQEDRLTPFTVLFPLGDVPNRAYCPVLKREHALFTDRKSFPFLPRVLDRYVRELNGEGSY